MRSYQALAWTALVLGLVCQAAAASAGAQDAMLYSDASDDQMIVEVAHQRALAQAAITPPGYACPLQSVAPAVTVRVRVAVRPIIRRRIVIVRRRRTVVTTVVSPATWAFGRDALVSAINRVYRRYGRAALPGRSIGGPARQAASNTAKYYTYTFVLPIGQCGADKLRLRRDLKAAIVALNTARAYGAKLSQFS